MTCPQSISLFYVHHPNLLSGKNIPYYAPVLRICPSCHWWDIYSSRRSLKGRSLQVPWDILVGGAQGWQSEDFFCKKDKDLSWISLLVCAAQNRKVFMYIITIFTTTHWYSFYRLIWSPYSPSREYVLWRNLEQVCNSVINSLIHSNFWVSAVKILISMRGEHKNWLTLTLPWRTDGLSRIHQEEKERKGMPGSHYHPRKGTAKRYRLCSRQDLSLKKRLWGKGVVMEFQ